MPSDNGREALAHIRYYDELIGRFVEGYDFPRFADDPRTFHAVTRCLEIISEASRRIPCRRCSTRSGLSSARTNDHSSGSRGSLTRYRAGCPS